MFCVFKGCVREMLIRICGRIGIRIWVIVLVCYVD